ncbi:unnamed protein product, partial [Discosporangium mesarthrocarpum]
IVFQAFAYDPWSVSTSGSCGRQNREHRRCGQIHITTSASVPFIGADAKPQQINKE